jgi:Polyketide cyclase / dehydrase and lipid transport
MAQFSMTKRIAAPIERVFDVATDLAHAAEHARSIEKVELLTSGPARVGTRWRETRKVMGGRSTETMEITALDRPHGYTVGCDSCGAYFETRFAFAPDGDGTLVMLDARTEARSWIAKLISPIGNMMFGKLMRKCMTDDLEDLARVAERQS